MDFDTDAIRAELARRERGGAVDADDVGTAELIALLAQLERPAWARDGAGVVAQVDALDTRSWAQVGQGAVERSEARVEQDAASDLTRELVAAGLAALARGRR